VAAAGCQWAVAVPAVTVAVATWVPVVLVYRLCTFWLPLIPGWISFLYLQKREAL